MSEFFIAYVAQTPPQLRRFLRKVVSTLLTLVVLVALVLLKAQKPFAAASFEYNHDTELEGAIQARPYPVLLVTRPGETAPGDAVSTYPLVAPGKHGADAMVAPFLGRQVRLRGKLIFRDGLTMIEVLPGSITPVAGSSQADPPVDLGPATLTGEIVDTKCYTGVMNPGRGKVHRECAARCLSGGIPPGFLARAPGEDSTVYLLTAADGTALPRQLLLDRIGESITLTGRRLKTGGIFQFRVQPDALERHHKTN